MPKITLNENSATNTGIAASGNTYLEFRANADCRFSIGATYVDADSQVLRNGDVRIFTGLMAGKAFSFSAGKDTVIDVSQSA